MTRTLQVRRPNRRRGIAGRARSRVCALTLLAVLLVPAVWAQSTAGAPQAQQKSPPTEKTEKPKRELGKDLFNLLNMAGARTAEDFTPLNQHQRNRLYLNSLINPLSFVRVGFSAGLDQWNNKPYEWGQGGEGYGKRYGNIFGQYTIQRTASFGLSGALDEDNRYFNSGKKGIWSRTWYALTSSVLARHHDGHRSISFSQIGGVAAGAFIARAWLPPSQDSAADGAVSFGISMASNAGTNVFKEFLPDIIHAFVKKPKANDAQGRK
jgi:hypothetical protein